jgi:hypothetical protein
VKLGPALERLVDAELGLADDCRRVGQTHAADHDVYHQTQTFAKQCEAHADKLRPIAERYGAEPAENGEPGLWDSVMEAVRRRASEVTGRRPESGLLLVRDLRELYLSAQETFITWVIVYQGAQAARDRELLEVSAECQLETELQVKWTLTQLKVQSPQALSA